MRYCAAVLVILVVISAPYAGWAYTCYEYGWDYSGYENDQGCYVYCVLDDDWIEVWCPYAWYHTDYYDFQCGPGTVNCPWECEIEDFYNRATTYCDCLVECPLVYGQGYQLVQYYTYDVGESISCLVCPESA